MWAWIPLTDVILRLDGTLLSAESSVFERPLREEELALALHLLSMSLAERKKLTLH